jgi:hypothetical protein
MSADNPRHVRRRTKASPRRSDSVKVATQTALQSAVLTFGNYLDGARIELGAGEFDALLSILAARIAGEYRLILELDELRERWA